MAETYALVQPENSGAPLHQGQGAFLVQGGAWMAPHRRWVEARAKVVREGQCRACGTTHGLEAAHLVPRSRIGPNGGAEDPRNIIPLCGIFEHGCHRAYDEHRLVIKPILTDQEIAYMTFLVGEGETQRRITLQRP